MVSIHFVFKRVLHEWKSGKAPSPPPGPGAVWLPHKALPQRGAAMIVGKRIGVPSRQAAIDFSRRKCVFV